MKSRRLLRSEAARVWTAALRAADPQSAVRKYVKRQGKVLQIKGSRLDLDKFRNIWVLGAGKAAAPMGQALEKMLGKYLTGGFLVTKYGHGLPMKKIEMMEAGHPLPDANSAAAATQILSLAKNLFGPDDLVFCVFSGGASSLVVSPAQGITLEDKLACTRLLLDAGASIHELNAVRKHLSSLKGGGLARLLAPMRVLSLILSDVVGDNAGTIASGPMSPDPTTFADCVDIFKRLELLDRIPPAIKMRFEHGMAGRIEETPKGSDPVFRLSETVIVGGNAQACAAAAQAAKRMGYSAMILTSRLEGDNEAAAKLHMSIAQEIVFQRRPLRRPACLISGGETTVKVAGSGMGGRNQEFVLHCVKPLAQLPAPCLVASLGTDGTDGPTDAAGAIADNTTLTRSLSYGACFLGDSLKNNDSYEFFQRLSDLIVTGPTRTNVMDLHIVMVG